MTTHPFLQRNPERRKHTREDAEALFMQPSLTPETEPTSAAAEPHKRQQAKPWTWTPEEKRKLGVFAYNYYRDNPTVSRSTAVAEAIKAVAAEDRQHIVPWENVKLWMSPMWDEFDAQNGTTINKQSRALVAMAAQAAARKEAEAETPAEPTAMAEALKAAQNKTDTPAPVQKERKRKVYWKDEHTEKVALEAARLMVEDVKGELSDVEVMRRAQAAALPEELHRAITQLANAKEAHARAVELMPVVRRNMVRKAEEERAARELEERRQREEQERIEREKNEVAMREQAEREAEAARLRFEEEQAKTRVQQEAFSKAVAAEVSKQLDQATYPALIGAIAKKVMGDFMGSLSSQIETIVSEAAAKAAAEQVKLAIEKMPAKEVPAAVVQIAPGTAIPADVTQIKRAPKDHTPKAIMVGLSYQQYDEIKKKFFGMCEFELVKAFAGNQPGSQASMDMIAAAKRGADVVVAMTDHCGKDVKIAGRTKLEEIGVPFVGITGSFSAARRWLEGWLNGEISLAA